MATNIIEIRNQLLGGGGNQSPAANMLAGEAHKLQKTDLLLKKTKKVFLRNFLEIQE